jgi:hypothetical protein
LARKIDELKQANQPETPAPAQADETEAGLGLGSQPGTDDPGGEEAASGPVPQTEEIPKKSNHWGWLALI